MPTRKHLLGCALLLAGLGALIMDAWLLNAARIERVRRDAAEARVEAERARAARLAERARSLRGPPPPPSSASTAAKENATPAAPITPRPFDVLVLLDQHPELRALFEGEEKESEMFDYGWLIARLTAADAERFKTEQLRHSLRGREISAATRARGVLRDDADARALRTAENERHAAGLRALLGDAAYREFQAHDQTLRARDAVATDLAGVLYYTDTPLTAAQSDQLTESVARHGTNAQGRFEVAAIDWPAVLSEARGLLAPAQFARLENASQLRQLYVRARQIEAEHHARTP